MNIDGNSFKLDVDEVCKAILNYARTRISVMALTPEQVTAVIPPGSRVNVDFIINKEDGGFSGCSISSIPEEVPSGEGTQAVCDVDTSGCGERDEERAT